MIEDAIRNELSQDTSVKPETSEAAQRIDRSVSVSSRCTAEAATSTPVQPFAKRLAGQAIHCGVFFGIQLAARLLLAVALGKHVSPETYGAYTLLATSLGMGGALLQLGAFQYYMREVPGQTLSSASALFKSIVGTQTILMVGVAIILIILPGPIGACLASLGLSMHLGMWWVLGGLFLCDMLATECGRYLTARAQIEDANVVNFLQNGFWPILIFLVAWVAPQHLTLALIVALWFIGTGLAVGYGIWRADGRALWRASFEPALYPRAVRFGFPMMMTTLCATVIGWSDRYFINAYHSAKAVGIYAYYYNIIVMLTVLAGTLVSNVLEPYIIAAHNTDQPERSSRLLEASLRYRLVLLIPLLIIIAAWSTPVITILAKPEYAVAPMLMMGLVPIPALMMVVNTYERVLFLERRTLTIAGCYLLAMVINVGLNILLIPRHPYYGAAFATDAALIALAGLLAFYARTSRTLVALAWRRLVVAGAVPLGTATLLVMSHWCSGMLIELLGGSLAVGVTYLIGLRLARVFSVTELQQFLRLLPTAPSTWRRSFSV